MGVAPALHVLTGRGRRRLLAGRTLRDRSGRPNSLLSRHGTARHSLRALSKDGDGSNHETTNRGRTALPCPGRMLPDASVQAGAGGTRATDQHGSRTLAEPDDQPGLGRPGDPAVDLAGCQEPDVAWPVCSSAGRAKSRIRQRACRQRARGDACSFGPGRQPPGFRGTCHTVQPRYRRPQFRRTRIAAATSAPTAAAPAPSAPTGSPRQSGGEQSGAVVSSSPGPVPAASSATAPAQTTEPARAGELSKGHSLPPVQEPEPGADAAGRSPQASATPASAGTGCLGADRGSWCCGGFVGNRSPAGAQSRFDAGT